MTEPRAAVAFNASRTKLISQAIVLAAFMLPCVVLSVISAVTLSQEDGVQFAQVAVFAAVTGLAGFFVAAVTHTLQRIAAPDLLIVTSNGLDLTIRGKRLYYPWTTLGEPELRRLSAKSASTSVVLPRLPGGKLVIMAEEYEHRARDILEALKQARGGGLIDPPQRQSQALYLFLAVPASSLTLGIVLAGLGTMLLT